jgi:FKBP-type peptidyl-prolyl cis-trans isomerase 2
MNFVQAGADGEVIEIAGKDKPAEFLFGVGNLIPEFEDQHQRPSEW